MVQTLADRYELGEELGSGGMGRVVRAHDRVLDREVAVKLLHEHLARQPSVRERFMREARSAVRFSHPNAVAVYDAGTEDRTLYIVMELIDGPTLADELEGGPLAPARAVHVASSVLEALAAAHTNGLVHRDLKPANIMLPRATPETGDGTANGEAPAPVKLTDFGIAKGLTEAGEKTLTMTGQVFGTPHYLAPEQADGKPATPASDVYAMGVVLYEMLTGRPPFDAESAFAVVIAHQNDEPTPVRRHRRDIDSALAAVVHRALKKDPKERYADAGDMRAALAELSRVRTLGRAPPPTATPTRPASPPAASRRTTGSPAPSGPRTGGASGSRRGGWRLVVVAAVLALLVLAGAALVSALGDQLGGQGDAPAEQPPEETEQPEVDEAPSEPEPRPEPEPEPEPEAPSDTDPEPPGVEQPPEGQ